MQSNDWFSKWFNSPYYHILYKNRDFSEAEQFIDALIQQLKFNPDQKFLDLACGKGRHSIYLNSKGFDVLGLDIAPDSIAHANKFSNEHLKFEVHDMRNSLSTFGQFDFILNLFTSFGYFEDENENINCIQQMADGLNPNGKIVLDFMNTHKIVKDLVASEIKTVDNINFQITRNIENGFIVKRIKFEDKGENYSFAEYVNAIYFKQFEKYFKACNLKIENVFGNYQLEKYYQETSPRMIMVASKL